MVNEQRLINANHIVYEEVYVPTETGAERVWAVTETNIDEMPTVDAVNVVRCKDCKRYVKRGGVHSNDYCSILYYCDGTHRAVFEEDFCSFGEK